MSAVVLCSRKNTDDPILIPEGVTISERPCAAGCGATLLISPSSLAIPNATFYCNDCGKAHIAKLAADPNERITLGIAPGQLERPGDAARRHELEAAGFRQFDEAEFKRLADD